MDDYDRPVCHRCDDLAAHALQLAGAIDVLVTPLAPAGPAPAPLPDPL